MPSSIVKIEAKIQFMTKSSNSVFAQLTPLNQTEAICCLHLCVESRGRGLQQLGEQTDTGVFTE